MGHAGHNCTKIISPLWRIDVCSGDFLGLFVMKGDKKDVAMI